MSEPDFRSQTTAPVGSEQRRAWFKARAKDANRQGARWHRYSFDEKTGVLLYEGWKLRPESEGDPRFQFISGPGGAT